jgi:CubicO group peptidase (beta-lactamase class C family)
MRLTLEVEPSPPHAIAGLGLREASPPPGQAPRAKLNPSEISSQLEQHLEKLVQEDHFSGAVLLAKDGQPLFKKAYGLASVAFQVPNKVDTKFNLASMGKMFTGVAVAQLAQQSKLSFDDLVGKHLPDYPNKAVAGKVTIHHLLTHTSGMGSYWNDKFEAAKDNIRKVADFLPFFVDDALQFEPGQRWSYSNAGYIVLGAIIEKVSGEDYYDYVREHVFKPAGMTNTDCYELDRDTPNLAIGYTRMGQKQPQTGPRRNNLLLHG